MNGGLDFLINGGDTAFGDIVQLDEVWDWSSNHLLSLLWTGTCTFGCNDGTAANYGAVVDVSDAGLPSKPYFDDDPDNWCTNETGACLDQYQTCFFCKPGGPSARGPVLPPMSFPGQAENFVPRCLHCAQHGRANDDDSR